jgi:hypothetical protein
MQPVEEGQDAMIHRVSRILAVSPEANETIRRNYSRIYVVPADEGVIDTMLFQGSRSLESYLPDISRAIAEFGLKTKIDLQLSATFDSRFGSGIFQQHIITNTWLQDDQGEAFDLFVELDLSNEDSSYPEMETFDGSQIEGAEFENPLCFKLDIQALSPQWSGMIEENSQKEEINTPPMRTEPKHEPEVGNRGRVVDPTKDRRLKQNRPEQLESARRSQDQDDPTARQAGKPGRVRYPGLDGRLSRNRSRPAEMAGAGGR